MERSAAGFLPFLIHPFHDIIPKHLMPPANTGYPPIATADTNSSPQVVPIMDNAGLYKGPASEQQGERSCHDCESPLLVSGT